MFNNIAKGFFEGLRDAPTPHKDKKKKEWEFQDLDTFPMLYSSNYLNDMYDKSTKKSHHESILGHIYRHQVEDIESYQNIEKKIINHYWKG